MNSKFFRPNSKRKVKGILSFKQLERIKLLFPNMKIVKREWDCFEIELKIQPTPLSQVYEVKIVYKDNRFIEIFVINRTLKIAINRDKLPHIYDSEKQQLCLYSPSKREWSAHNYIDNTVIPWTSEWLYYYELWLPEGKWLGGGHNEYPNEDFTKTLKNG